MECCNSNWRGGLWNERSSGSHLRHRGQRQDVRSPDLFRHEQAKLLKACTPGGAVWITPTNRSRRDIARRLLDASLRACLAPNVLTFDSFAERLLRTSGSQIVSLSPVARRMIARAVVDDAQAAGSLPYFTPIARTSGFLDLFLNFVSELKRDETWPEQFEQSCRQRGWLPWEPSCPSFTAVTRCD